VVLRLSGQLPLGLPATALRPGEQRRARPLVDTGPASPSSITDAAIAQLFSVRYVVVVPRLTRSRIDKLGDALAGSPTDADRDLYFELREAYVPASANVEERLRRLFPDRPPLGRLKTLDSVRAKLLRKTTRRLSTMQDIAGHRLVFENVHDQDNAIEAIASDFVDVRFYDIRGGSPSGYRAVHLIVGAALAGELKGQVEIQVRTALQDEWAQTSEKLTDRYGSQIKYEPASLEAGAVLMGLSDVIRSFEQMESDHLRTVAEAEGPAGPYSRWLIDPERDTRRLELKEQIRDALRMLRNL
jgi:hypothetical protein